MIDSNETHEKIISYLKKEGPSLPIKISKELEMSSLFISAFLSELSKQKRIKVTSLKVGGSPLYFVEGQEEKLENFYKYLHPKEAEAFQLLKKHKILKDSEQNPAIRVALRSIKDFASAFKLKEEIYWKYVLARESEINNILNPRLETKEEIEKKEVKKEETEKNPNESEKINNKENLTRNITSDTNTPLKTTNPIANTAQEKPASLPPNQESIKPKIIENVDIAEVPKEMPLKTTPQIIANTNQTPSIPAQLDYSKKEETFNNPLIIKEEKKKKKKPKSEFAIKSINFIRNIPLRIIEEKNFKAREYTCITRINSELGNIDFFTQSKNKKTITENDFKKLLSTSQSIPLPALLIYTGTIGKKAKEFANKYHSILKLRKMDILNNNNL